MSILYQVRAVAVESRTPNLDALQGSFFHAMNNNHRGLAARIGLNLSGAPRKVGLAEYVELARGQFDPKVAAEPFATPDTGAALAELAQSYRDGGRAPGPWASKRLYIAHRVAAALDSSQDKLPLLQISMEVLSVHPDAGFPRWRLNATVKDNDERAFLCRLLADMMRPLEDELIPSHVAESEKTDTMRDAMHTLVWGFTRQKKRPQDPAAKQGLLEEARHHLVGASRTGPPDSQERQSTLRVGELHRDDSPALGAQRRTTHACARCRLDGPLDGLTQARRRAPASPPDAGSG